MSPRFQVEESPVDRQSERRRGKDSGMWRKLPTSASVSNVAGSTIGNSALEMVMGTHKPQR